MLASRPAAVSIHNNADGKIALIAVESPAYKQLLHDPGTTKIKAFRSSRA